ncbi:helix-turn-helix domain-containing protein [Gammaproteobacteria bacterium]|nr:helix-turn-helix domain-containing protein [Gammaproteobacteria bacterium]
MECKHVSARGNHGGDNGAGAETAGKFRRSAENQTSRRVVRQYPGLLACPRPGTGISRRTLQRRLRERGSRFRQVLQGVKASLASRYRRDGRLSVVQFAAQPGRSDHSTFSAGFRSWMGQAPILSI